MNAELIKALRYCAEHEGCDYYIAKDCPRESTWMCGVDCGQILMLDAADALEAADEKIADCVAAIDALDDSNDAYIKANERLKKRIKELETQLPKEGEWVWENYYWHCSACGENPTRGMGYVQGKNELFRVCPNCGARMRTVTDCHASGEGER